MQEGFEFADPGSPLLTVADYERRAREILPAWMFQVLFGVYGDPDWETETNNLDALHAMKLRPRVMRDIAEISLSTTVLGSTIAAPVMIAPSGHHQRYHADGELATARGSAGGGTVMALSTASSYSIEEVADVTDSPLWFQLYIFRNRELTELLVRRAEAAGYVALVITVDSPGTRSREREYSWRADEQRAQSLLQPDRVMRNFHDLEFDSLPTLDNFGEHLSRSFTWSDLDQIRNISSMPIVLKGIQTPEDALLCKSYGIDGLIVSNHGGHALRDAGGTPLALGPIVDAVGDAVEVYIDGGIRRGEDVLKCLSLGARAALIGRAQIWGLAVAGEEGVTDVLNIIYEQLRRAMAFCGVRDVREVGRSLVALPTQQLPSMI